MRALLIVLLSLTVATCVLALPTDTGYSGAPGRGTCAASCHGLAGGTVQVFGFPNQYVPNQTYLITVQKMSGVSIKNFNASCRLGTGSANAGTITGGEFTATYNVFGETNGVHMTTLDHDSAQFNWTAPAPGFGILRLYVGALQGNQNSGLNTTLVLVSTEAPILPGQASGPTPADGATGVPPSIGLHWTAGSGSTTHDVYYGTTNPPPLLAQYFEGVFFDPDPDPFAGTTYYWRIDARNDFGVTEGNVWSFTVMNAPGPATNPIPADQATDILLAPFLEWTPGSEATSHDVYFGIQADPPFLVNVTQPVTQVTDLLPGTTYFWRVDERNEVGTTPGAAWQFTTMSLPAPATNPTPANGSVDVAVTSNLSWTADSGAGQFDIYLGTQNPPPDLAGTTQTTTFNPPGVFSPNTTYYWRVGSHNEAGSTPSEVWSFTTEASAADEPGTMPTQYVLAPAYPNPFNAAVSISFALPQASVVRLAIYDVLGREVAVLAQGTQMAGWHTVSWSAEGAGSGVYLVRLTQAQGMLTQKVVALK